ncbi:transcription initiation at TATA-containing promoter protein [Sorochytrium milnesiophthora]
MDIANTATEANAAPAATGYYDASHPAKRTKMDDIQQQEHYVSYLPDPLPSLSAISPQLPLPPLNQMYGYAPTIPPMQSEAALSGPETATVAAPPSMIPSPSAAYDDGSLVAPKMEEPMMMPAAPAAPAPVLPPLPPPPAPVQPQQQQPAMTMPVVQHHPMSATHHHPMTAVTPSAPTTPVLAANVYHIEHAYPEPQLDTPSMQVPPAAPLAHSTMPAFPTNGHGGNSNGLYQQTYTAPPVPPPPPHAMPVVDVPVMPPAPAPAAPPAAAAAAAGAPPQGKNMTPAQAKYIASVIKALKRLKDAHIFLVPVDPVRLNIPDYPLIIKEPMDISTIERKIAHHEYFTVEQFASDVNLMLDNCIRYNGPTSIYGTMTNTVRKSFEKQMEKLPSASAPSTPGGSGGSKSNKAPRSSQPRRPSEDALGPRAKRDSVSSNKYHGYDTSVTSPTLVPSAHPSGSAPLPSKPSSSGGMAGFSSSTMSSSSSSSSKKSRKPQSDMQFCQSVIKELFKKQYAEFTHPFLQPVDARMIPEYYQIIRKPVDLSTMKRKLDDNMYLDADAFEEDMQQLLRNCFKFNPPGSQVHAMGQRLQELFRKKWANKPEPASAAVVIDDLDDDSDDDGTNALIASLEKQVKAMQQQLEQMRAKQREKRHKKTEMRRREAQQRAQQQQQLHHQQQQQQSRSDGPKVRGRGSHHGNHVGSAGNKTPKSGARPGTIGRQASEPQIEVTYDMKKQLSDSINFLSVEKLHQVYAIIQESVPNLQETANDEIELDIASLDNSTIYRLWQLVTEETSRKADAPPPVNPVAMMKQTGQSSDEEGDSDSSGSDSD